MKYFRLNLFLLILTWNFAFNQIPQGIKYQTVVRNTDGDIIQNQVVEIRLRILHGEPFNEAVTDETFQAETNEFGLVNLVIGSIDSNDFAAIDWGNGPYSLEVSMNGISMGISELFSVPYALYSGNSGPWQENQGTIFYNEGSIGIGTSTPDSSAQLDISSATKGFLPPRMTREEIRAIKGPANGLVVFCMTDSKYYGYIENLSAWREIMFGDGYIFESGFCDSSLNVNHIQGDVAPVTKTVTYFTVGNLPGEPLRCWIQSNLGADHVADSMKDIAEASAGWYWQFNKKQGYKYDTQRIPDLPWETNLEEDSEWLPENDPCSIELGGMWRLPTYDEWYNVIVLQGWIDWNDAWTSPLRLHTGGFLNWNSGTIANRGMSGSHWSSAQSSITKGFHIDFRSTNCGVYQNSKSYGLSVRCIE